MTVIGEAYINVKGVVEGDTAKAIAGVESDVQGVGTSAEKSSGRAKAAFKAMGGALTAAFGPALGPVGEIMDKFKEVGDVTEGMHDKVGKSMLGIGAGATAAGTLITTMSDKDKISMKQLELAVTNAGGSWDKYKDKTEEVVKHQETYGHTAVETQDALGTLITKTHQTTASYENMQVVADLAAQKHTSLASAAELVARVMNGQTRTLKLYGISQDSLNAKLDTGKIHEKNLQLAQAEQAQQTAKNASAALSLRDAHIREALASTTDKNEQAKLKKELQDDATKRAELSHAMSVNSQKATTLKGDLKTLTTGTKAGEAGVALLAAKLKGQAAAAADTFSGRMKEVKAKIEDFVGTVGQKVGPVLQVAGPALMGFGAVMETGVIQKMGKGVKALALWDKESKIVQAGTKIWTALNDALGVSEDVALGPILLIVAAVAALGIAFYLAYTKIKPFHDLINMIARDIKKWFLDAFNAVKNAFTDFVHGFEVVWQVVVGIIKRYGLLILAAVLPMIGIPLLIITHWKQIVAFFTALPGQIVSAVGNIGRTLWSAISAGITWIKGKFKDAIDLWIDIYIKFPVRVLKAIGNLGSKIWTNITDGLATLKSKIMDFIGGVVDFFTTFPAKVMRAIGNLGSQIWGGITAGLANMKSKVVTWVSNAVGWFGALPAKAVRAIGDVGAAIWRGISSGLSSLLTKISGQMSKAKSAVTGAFKGAATWLYQVGKDILGGLASGLIAAVKGVVSSAKNAASSVVSGVKSVFHIGSPSKVFHEIGMNLLEGLAGGITTNLGKVDAAMRGVHGALRVPLNANAAGVTGGGAAGAVSSTRVINLFPYANIDFGKQSPAHVVQSLESALRASRM